MHDLLKKQLQQAFATPITPETLPPEWSHFINLVDQTYQQADQRRYLMEHTIEANAAELIELNKKLQADIAERTIIERNLKQERDLLSTILDHNSALVIVLDESGHIISFNKACECISGYKMEDVIGQQFCDVFVLKSQREAMARLFRNMRDDRANSTFTSQWVIRNERIRLVEWSNALLLDDNGRVEYIVMTGRDFTEQKQGEIERENLLKTLHQRSIQLETAAAVSKSIVTILDSDELVQNTVSLIKQSFNFYYVGLFMIDSERQKATLKAGTGEAGENMIAAGHALVIGGDSMIGQCVATGNARIALDVGLEAKRFDNPHLPKTRSELALPLIHHGHILGALSVQSIQESAFSEEDITVLQTMVDQVAIALENARLFEEARHEIEERKIAQRQLEEAQNFLNTLFDTLPTYFHVKDLDGRFVRVNKWTLEGFNQPMQLDDVLGKTDFDFFQEDIAAKYRNDELEIIRTGEPIMNKEEVNIDINGLIRWFLTTKAPLRDAQGNIIGTVGASQEITAQKEAEAALLEAQRFLEDRVRERTIQLEAANKELEAFAYSVSHDLRAPLRAINGFSQALVEDYGDELDDVAQDYIERLRRASQRMGQLIDDLLTLSRVTRRELIIEKVNLSELAREIAQDLHELEPQRAVQFSIANNLYVEGDERLLRVMLENLINNAWKFTSQRNIARIEFGCNAVGDYFVKDNGVGFDMAYEDKLFRAFQRLHTPTEFEGTGIGLATVNRVILRHGGQIWAQGEVDKGATFYFNLTTKENG